MRKRIVLATVLMALTLVGCKPSEEKLAEAEEARLQLQTARQTAEETYLDIADTSLRSELDKLGRCGTAIALLDRTMMPTEERGSIGQIRPSGWNQEKYPGLVDSDPPYLLH